MRFLILSGFWACTLLSLGQDAKPVDNPPAAKAADNAQELRRPAQFPCEKAEICVAALRGATAASGSLLPPLISDDGTAFLNFQICNGKLQAW
jgi:hypothetical protein